MLKALLCFLLALTLALVLGLPVQAAPPPADERGSFFVFGEYTPLAFLGEKRFLAGAGWLVGEDLILGLTATIAENPEPGAFIGYVTGPLLAQGEARNSSDGWCYRLAAFYRVEVADFLLGVGLGMIEDAADSMATFFAANASLTGETMTIYVEGDYFANGPYVADLSLGISYAF